MEQAIMGILGGGITTDALLLLIITLFITKRIVPWWVHEQLIEDFEKLEATVPSLSDSVRELVDLIDEAYGHETIRITDENRRRQEELRNVIKRTRAIPKTRTKQE